MKYADLMREIGDHKRRASDVRKLRDAAQEDLDSELNADPAFYNESKVRDARQRLQAADAKLCDTQDRIAALQARLPSPAVQEGRGRGAGARAGSADDAGCLRRRMVPPL